jgi:hypothetical protein
LTSGDHVIFAESEHLSGSIFLFNPPHPSHATTAASDVNPRRSHAEDLENKELKVIYEVDQFTKVTKMKMERLQDALPLHYAVLTLTNKELKTYFATYADNEIS